MRGSVSLAASRKKSTHYPPPPAILIDQERRKGVGWGRRGGWLERGLKEMRPSVLERAGEYTVTVTFELRQSYARKMRWLSRPRFQPTPSSDLSLLLHPTPSPPFSLTFFSQCPTRLPTVSPFSSCFRTLPLSSWSLATVAHTPFLFLSRPSVSLASFGRFVQPCPRQTVARSSRD